MNGACVGECSAQGLSCCSCVPEDVTDPAAAANAASKVPTSCVDCRVFVTRGVYTGDLGGLEGADALCNQAAETAKLGGTWMAWLSDSTHPAITRIHGDGPWNLVDGTLAFPSHAALAIDPRVQLNLDEARRPYTPAYCWSGTNPYHPATFCSDWTSTSGKGTYVYWGSIYENIVDDDCSNVHSLICLEQ